MSKKQPQPKSLPKGLLAGLIGGLAGVLAMGAAERLIALRAHKGTGPEEAPASASEEMHWSFGAAIGAVYGAAAEYFPSATAKQGVAFGLAVQSFTQQGTLPAVGLLTGSVVADTPPLSGITSHVVYGVTTEIVRKVVRKCL